jgi:uncharacterized protein (DUF2141 family)
MQGTIMHRAFLAVIAVAMASTSAMAAPLATLTVTVAGITDKGGNLRIGLYNEAQFVVRGTKPVTGEVIAAKSGTMTVALPAVAPGDYGIKVLQDENANGKMDTSFGMIPSEPYGFSNDASPHMGPPDWSDAKITLKPGANATTVHLR